MAASVSADMAEPSANVFPLNRFATFWQDNGRTMDLDDHKEYQDWLASIVSESDASTLGNGIIPVSEMSACAAGWRGVLRADVLDKVRVLSLAEAWLDAPEDKFPLFLPSQIVRTGQRYWYVHGHHRGGALHAMLAFHLCMLDNGFELPCWLAKMVVGVPADMADVAGNFATRLDFTSRGMARTLKM